MSFIGKNFRENEVRLLIADSGFFPLGRSKSQISLLNRITDTSEIAISANEVIDGKIKYFFKDRLSIKKPVDWHVNPFNGARWPANVHWCDLGSFGKDFGDIKSVWELSRFSWAYELVRAYLATNNPKYAEAFWELFEHWLENNEPNRGVNWKCGQECALRVMALCFALFGFQHSPCTTEERIKKMFLALAVHGKRIEKFISDAVRQKNNHAITQAAGLYTLGILFPFFRYSRRWHRLGKKILEREGFRQIYEDGSYVQQSMNYHRLVLQAYLWCFRLADINGDEFTERLKNRLFKAVEWLYQMQNDSTGRVPNYGPNDGAVILPLSNCDYLDYRPVLQSCWYLFKGERLFDSGPWDEDLFWIFGSDALDAPRTIKQRTSSEFAKGGYYTLVSPGKKSWAMIRCHTYCDRVGHADILHLDFWAETVNLLRDCGSYRYFAPDEPEFERYFKSIWAHNTVIVDGDSPLRLVSRFIYLPWPMANLDEFRDKGNMVEWRGTHFAYAGLPWNVIHSRRVVGYENERWQIFDELKGRDKHKLELRWHTPAESEISSRDSHHVSVRLPAGWVLDVENSNEIEVELLRADPKAKGGWESLYYACKTPVSTISVVTFCQLPTVFKTTISKKGV
jgi:hypothetical protein